MNFIPEKFRGLNEAELAVKVLEGYCSDCYGAPWEDGGSVHYPWCTRRQYAPQPRFLAEYYQKFIKE